MHQSGGEPRRVCDVRDGILLHTARPDLGQCQWLGVARNSVQLSNSLHHERQLHPAVPVNSHINRSGWIRDLASAPSGVFPNSNQPTQITPALTDAPLPFLSRTSGKAASYAITAGNSFYHSLQTKVEKRFASGLNFLATYTWSKTRTDAGDLLNGGSNAGLPRSGCPWGRDPL